MNRNSERSRPTPSPPSSAICVGVLEPADVGDDFDARAVERHRRLVRVREVFLAALLGALLRAGGCASTSSGVAIAGAACPCCRRE